MIPNCFVLGLIFRYVVEKYMGVDSLNLYVPIGCVVGCFLLIRNDLLNNVWFGMYLLEFMRTVFA